MSKAKIEAHHERVTKLICEAIEAGAGKFEMPWYGGKRAHNVASGNSYRGTNAIVLMVMGMGRSSEWGTFLQWNKFDGAKIKKGSKAVPIFTPINVYSKEETDENGKPKFLYRNYGTANVFNRDDVEGIPEFAGPTEIPVMIDQVEEFVDRTGAVVNIEGSSAHYDLITDEIWMPSLTRFKEGNATEAFYSVLLHELSHWTGSESRLGRFDKDTPNMFGSPLYSEEELVAEIASALLCADLQISPTPRVDHARYIDSWLSNLKSNPHAFSEACTKAEAVVSYLMELTNWNVISDEEQLEIA